MNRKQVIILIRRLLKRMENEEYEIKEEFDYNFLTDTYLPTNLDVISLRFLGPKRRTKIPPVLIVWPNGTTEERSYNQVRGLNPTPTYLYCPIDINAVEPIDFRNELLTNFTRDNVNYKKAR